LRSFSFKQIDPNDPSREFDFCLRCDDLDDTYQLMTTTSTELATDPAAPTGDSNKQTNAAASHQKKLAAVQASLVAELNRTDDMSLFVRKMRRAFVAFARATAVK